MTRSPIRLECAARRGAALAACRTRLMGCRHLHRGPYPRVFPARLHVPHDGLPAVGHGDVLDHHGLLAARAVLAQRLHLAS
jgi:hypothetical protein